MFRQWLTGAALVMVSLPLSAATLSGSILDPNGAGITGMEVRLWEEGPKGYSIQSTTASAAGAYEFSNVPAGNYKIDVRMPDGDSRHFGDTWYDVAAPISDGLIAADADVLTVADADALTGLDITMPLTGRLESTVFDVNMRVRVESTTDHRYHHTDISKNLRNTKFGGFVMAGLLSNHSYRIIGYDPTGNRGMAFGGPHQVTAGGINVVGGINLPPFPADPGEPSNDVASAVQVTTLPHVQDAILSGGPDVDWYCTTVQDGDRLMVDVSNQIEIDGVTREHPWFDPILGFFDATGTTELGYNDDHGGTRASHLDTGILSAGTYCFVVSAFGDPNFGGVGKQSVGPYTFGVSMGNRVPDLSVTQNGAPVPDAAMIGLDEAETITFDLEYTDPDNDALTVTVTQTNAAGDDVTDGALTLNENDGTYSWTPSQTAAPDGPYTIEITITDGEFTETVVVVINVNAVNLAPPMPILLSPIDQVRVIIPTPTLVVGNVVDPDEDPLQYEFQLREGSPTGEPDQTNLLAQGPDTTTEWQVDTLTENAFVFWRARAFDGDVTTGYSPWTTWQSFRVDAVNDPPGVPEILKPTNGETVMVLTPRVSASVPTDPEEEAVSVVIELAADDAFENVLQTSEALEPEPLAASVEWTPSELELGRYFLRAKAVDERGAESDWSVVTDFEIYIEPDTLNPPSFGDAFGEYCGAGREHEALPDFVEVQNVNEDPTTTFEVAIYHGGAAPVYTNSVAQNVDAATTEIPIEQALVEPGAYLFQVRVVAGDVSSNWTDCEMRLVGDDGVEPPSPTPTGADEGCGCASTNGAGNTGMLLMLLGFLALRRRGLRPLRTGRAKAKSGQV